MVLRRLGKMLARTTYAQRAIAEAADLSAFRERPSARLVLGVSLIALSFAVCWPGVAACGIAALYFDNPWIIVIGGPTCYGASWLIWAVGMYFAGAQSAHYGNILARWAVRRLVEKLVPCAPGSVGQPDNSTQRE